MGTWITSIRKLDGDYIGGKEDYWLGKAIYDLWDERSLHKVEDGKTTYQYRLSGKVQPVLDRMKTELDKSSVPSSIELYSGIVERLSALDPDSELYIELFDW
ncbi:MULTISPECIES: hypothetical protein [Micrococcaceae]|uniref:hypothetical protein n=1 Tax=Micrococcaceae TaxID=1268 RepID=UPI0010360D46|nr:MULTISPECIES: hypothetical protein [Micrococcaceae]TAP25831.1 hypothetical protein EYR88_12795 [Arthrobacter sp. S41]UXN31761.1 hypothetical protein N6V40_15805 [Glutamicibacter sp. M10]